MRMKAAILFLIISYNSLDTVSSFSNPWQSSRGRTILVWPPSLPSVVSISLHNGRRASELCAGGWGNNQERSVSEEELGGVNGSPIYDSYAIEDRGQFMQRVNEERKSLRIKKAADLLECARIAGVELTKKVRDPEKLDMFDPEELTKKVRDPEKLD